MLVKDKKRIPNALLGLTCSTLAFYKALGWLLTRRFFAVGSLLVVVSLLVVGQREKI